MKKAIFILERIVNRMDAPRADIKKRFPDVESPPVVVLMQQDEYEALKLAVSFMRNLTPRFAWIIEPRASRQVGG